MLYVQFNSVLCYWNTFFSIHWKKGYLCSQVHDEYVLFVAQNAEN